MLSTEEIERRVPVWSVMADLFLDTQYEQADYVRIADHCREAGYPVDELKRIFFDEVAPAFALNLFDIAGEWAGWHDDFVREKVLRDLAPERRIWHRIKRAIMLHHMEKAWVRVASLI